jgi:hypothetical protein
MADLPRACAGWRGWSGPSFIFRRMLTALPSLVKSGYDAAPWNPSKRRASPFSNMRARCARCGAGAPVRVHFDRGCKEVIGAHFHRECTRCEFQWAEQTREATRVATGSGPARTAART